MTIISNAGRKVAHVKGYVMDTIQPKIHADSNIIDYDTIPQGSNGHRIFTFKNTGKKPLIVKRAKCSGGCYANNSKAPILPNETGEVKIKYDTKRIGRIRRSVTLETNNERKPHYIIYLRGFVKSSQKDRKKSILDE